MGDIAEWMINKALDEELRYCCEQEELFEQYQKQGCRLQWKQRDGTKIALKDMTSSHIQNCMNMIEKLDPGSMWIEIFGCELEKRAY